MKAMLLRRNAAIETSPLQWTDVPDPTPGPGEVRIRVEYCAICRTDLHVIEGDLPVAKLPVIPGHQAVGIVDQLGTGARRFKAGERIGIAWLHRSCGRCEFCKAGRENLCGAPRFTGYHEDGGFAELATVPEDFAYGIPAAFDPAHATPLLCAGIIGYRALSRAALPEGGTLGIYGFGSSAHVVIQLALARGSKVFVVTRGAEHQEFARKLGANWASGDSRGMPEKLDSAILFAPAGELVPAAMENLKSGGILSIAGIHLSDVPALNYEKHLFHEKEIRSVTANTRADGRGLLEEARRIPVRTEITVYDLKDANRALQDLQADRINGTGVLRIG